MAEYVVVDVSEGVVARISLSSRRGHPGASHFVSEDSGKSENLDSAVAVRAINWISGHKEHLVNNPLEENVLCYI